MVLPLTVESVNEHAHRLAHVQPFFRYVIERYGPPPLWARPPGFATLIWIILEQQVSLASARAAFLRLQARLPEVSPQAFLTLDDETLKAVGFSRQKTGYARGLAQAILSGQLHLESLAEEDDEIVRQALVRLKGIGPWTADIYLLMALGRPDIWPAQDLGLVVAVRHGLRLETPPSREEMETIGAAWRPYRSVAARLFWHYYLSELRPPKS
jgi:DNA-3-methyladenine glycosylase II